MILNKTILISFLILIPLIAFAQINNAQDLIYALGNFFALATKVMVGIAVLVLFWGIAMRVFNFGSEEKVKEANRIMVWGVIAIFVMISLAGIIYFIQEALDLSGVPDNAQIFDSSGVPVPGGGPTDPTMHMPDQIDFDIGWGTNA